MVPSVICRRGDLFEVWVVNASDKEDREADEFRPWREEEEGGKVPVEILEEVEEESGVDVSLGADGDITFF